MAKSSIFVVLLSILTHSVCAQNPSNFYVEEPRTFYGGLVAGTNFSQVDGDSYAGYHKVGINVGGIVYTHLGENLAASLEILYAQKGSRGHKQQLSAGNQFLITDYRINLNYAEVPVMLNYFDHRRSHFGGGISYSQLVSADEKITTDPFDPNTANLDQYKFRKSDFNILLAGNLHLWKGLFLNMRFQYSLAPVRKTIPPGYGRAEQYNNLWTVRLMYLF